MADLAFSIAFTFLGSSVGSRSSGRAAMPATNGQAMLVPALIRLSWSRRTAGPNPESPDRAAPIMAPGAATSGFLAPSRRGPSLLKSEMVLSSRADWWSVPMKLTHLFLVVNDATVTAEVQHPGEPTFML